MTTISVVAWALVLLIGGVIAYVKIDTWWHYRKLKKWADEVIAIAREAGFSEHELKTYCYGCKRYSVGFICPYCESAE